MKIVLGVTGGIAAYKAASIVRAFRKRGDEVRVVMTNGAREFITPMTLQVVSENPVGVELFDPTYESQIGHIDLARWADVVLVAPATANAIARMAHGHADDLLTTVITATTAPIVVAPAMNTQMYLNPLVQKNLEILESVGFFIVDPDTGALACKEVGPGRLPDPPVLEQCVDAAVSQSTLENKRVLITAGPTREHLDPARFISNPSTGKMGFALARQAQVLGADVLLVTGPSELLAPYGVRRINVVSAQGMHDAVMAEAAECDFVAMAAAVADWRPLEPSQTKREKAESDSNLPLERTPDILMALTETYTDGSPFIVGFAAESHDVEERGRAKFVRKRAGMLVANAIGGPNSTFGSDHARACLITDSTATWVEGSKVSVASDIWACAIREAKTHSPHQEEA